MGFRFRRRITLAKGISLNLGKRGPSLTVGAGPLRTTYRADGSKRTSVSLPGTGISYGVEHPSADRTAHTSSTPGSTPDAAATPRRSLGAMLAAGTVGVLAACMTLGVTGGLVDAAAARWPGAGTACRLLWLAVATLVGRAVARAYWRRRHL